MRRKDKEVRDLEEMEDILREAQVIRVAMCDDGTPYCVPMIFGYCDGKIYLHSAREGRKLSILKVRNTVCFEADVEVQLIRAAKPCDWTMKYRSVIGLAEASFITEREEKRRALCCIVRHYSGETCEFSDEELEKVEVIRLDVREMRAKRSPI